METVMVSFMRFALSRRLTVTIVTDVSTRRAGLERGRF